MDLIEITKRIIDKADTRGLNLRAFGRVGVAISCGIKDIETEDIDLFGLNIKDDLLKHFFNEIRFSVLDRSDKMMKFRQNELLLDVDVYLDELKFAFKIPGPYSSSSKYTIPITQLFLSKLYFNDNDWKERDKQDLITILRTHEIGKSKDFQTIRIDILKEIWCCNSNSFAVSSFCEKKLIELSKISDDEPNVKAKIEYLLEFMRKAPKNCPYKMGKCFKMGKPEKVECAYNGDIEE